MLLNSLLQREINQSPNAHSIIFYIIYFMFYILYFTFYIPISIFIYLSYLNLLQIQFKLGINWTIFVTNVYLFFFNKHILSRYRYWWILIGKIQENHKFLFVSGLFSPRLPSSGQQKGGLDITVPYIWFSVAQYNLYTRRETN